MKKILFALCLMPFALGGANAADVKLYYSPTCPHCHHAMDFLRDELAYEFQSVRIITFNLSDSANMDAFRAALAQCKYESGGVPVMVIGDKCFQGYADFMKQDLRDAASVGLSDAEKQAATANVKEFEANPDAFRTKHADRANALQEQTAGAADAQKKTDGGNSLYFYGFLALLVVGLGAVLLMKKKKK